MQYIRDVKFKAYNYLYLLHLVVYETQINHW